MLTKNRVLVSLDWYLVGELFRFVETAEANKFEPKKTTLMTFELGLPKDIETTLSTLKKENKNRLSATEHK